jgi:hypothetical protein
VPAKGLEMWVVYDHPLDFPNVFVARRWEGVTPTGQVLVNVNLTELRHQIRARGDFIRWTRADDDDPKILEVWL